MALSLSSLHTRLALRHDAWRRPVVTVRSNIGKDASKNAAKPEDRNAASTGSKSNIPQGGAGKPLKDAGSQAKVEPKAQTVPEEEDDNLDEDVKKISPIMVGKPPKRRR